MMKCTLYQEIKDESSQYIPIVLPELNNLLFEQSLYYLLFEANNMDQNNLIDLNMIYDQPFS